LRILTRISLIIILLVGWAGCNSEGLERDSADTQTFLNLIEMISAENLGRTIKDLENFKTRYTWEKQEAVANYLVQRLADYGLQLSIDEYDHNEKIWRNVVVCFPGKRMPEEIYMIIAHYDSTSEQPEFAAPGADDNGTGTAAAIEIARMLKETSLDSTVKIAFFSNEEQGRLGSKHFTKKARSENQDIRGTINLDVIGYNNPIGSIEYGEGKKGSLLSQAKRQLKMVRNYAYSKLYPYGRVTVAGRPSNRGLVKKTSKAVKEFTRLGVVKDIDEDCG